MYLVDSTENILGVSVRRENFDLGHLKGVSLVVDRRIFVGEKVLGSVLAGVSFEGDRDGNL